MSGALLEIRDVCKVFDRGKPSEIVAAHHINLTLRHGECIAVVGESGCGKSTLAKLITAVERPDSGQIIFGGEDITALRGAALRQKRQQMQMVFQQPMSAISPRMTIGRFMKVPLENFKVVENRDMEAEVDRLLDMVQLPSGYNRYLPGLIYSVLAPIYLFFALRAECMPAAVMLLVVSLVITPINNLFKEINDRMKGDYWDTLEKLTSYYLESINGLTTTELFNRGNDREKKLGGIAQHMRDIILDVMVLNFSSTALNELLINAAIVAAVGIVCAQLAAGRIALTNALTVLMLSYSFFSSIRALQWIAHDALHGVAASQNIAKILDIDTHKPVNGDATVYDRFEGIRFDDVSFAYKGRDSVLKHVNLDIPHNGITAIAGESGCGKSTIVNMLLRFYDAKSGRITLNGRDYLSIDPSELRKRVVMVPQSVYVFSGTVRENLLIAKPGATDAELYEALEQVRLRDWIDAQPEGLDAPVGDAGARLSGGQRQKLGIARALLSRAEYIIFDEATSSVDEENEREIWRCIGELAETRTLIIISHRLSTIRNADVIYLIDDGRVAERGSHDELMAQGGKYRRLVEEQDRLEADFGRRATA